MNTVTIELERNENSIFHQTMQNIVVTCNVDDTPNIESLTNAQLYPSTSGFVSFLVEQLDDSATMKFITSTHEHSLYPISISFNMQNTLLGLEVVEAIDGKTSTPISY